MPKLSARLAWFVLIGCAAAGVHWVVAVTLVGLRHWPPLLANVLGWASAFCVSFAGHHRLTFHGHGSPLLRALPRFFAISACGFILNELSYALLLHWAPAYYQLSLAGVLVGVAGLTYLLSQRWAFLRSPSD